MDEKQGNRRGRSLSPHPSPPQPPSEALGPREETGAGWCPLNTCQLGRGEKRYSGSFLNASVEFGKLKVKVLRALRFLKKDISSPFIFHI